MLATILSLVGVGGVGALAFFYPPFAALLLSAGKAALAFLSKLSLSQILCGVLAIALIVGHVVDHRRLARLEAQLSTCSTSLAGTRTALDTTVASYRAAAARATADDAANKARVEAQQAAISKEQSNEYETRIAAARAAADRLRAQLAAAANSRGSAKPVVPGLSAPPGGPDQAAGDDGLSVAERLTATEQAIQLDELIKWVRKQAGVDVNGQAPKP